MTLDERIARVVEAEAGVVSAYLFGSHAKDRAHRESDVGVLLNRGRHPASAGRFEVRVRLSSVLEHALPGPHPDVVVLNDVPPGLAASIVTTGRRVYVADEAADRSFRRDAQLRAADMVPFLRRTRRLKLEAVRRVTYLVERVGELGRCLDSERAVAGLNNLGPAQRVLQNVAVMESNDEASWTLDCGERGRNALHAKFD